MNDLNVVISQNRKYKRITPVKFMMRHFGALQAEFSECEPNWEILREAFATIGVRHKDGSPLAAETLRGAWWRVRKSRAATPHFDIQNVAEVAQLDQGNDGEIDALKEIRRQMLERSGRGDEA